MTQLAPINFEEQLQHVQWPDPSLKGLFLRDIAEHCQHVDVETIKKWVWLIGKPSQFLEHKVWTVADCIAHYIKLDSYLAEEESSKTADKKDPVVTPPVTREEATAQSIVETAAKEERAAHAAKVAQASEDWHKAVGERMVAIKNSHDWTRDEIARLKAAHVTLTRRWTEHTDHKREALKTLRGY